MQYVAAEGTVMRTTIACLIFAIALNFSLESGKSQAASRVTDDFAELVTRAMSVVDASVTDLKAEESSALGMPRTIVTAKVTASYKGNLAAGETFECEIFGGACGKYNVMVPGQAHLSIGDRGLLLLTKIAGNWRVLGGDVGHVAYYRDDDGASMARRESGVIEYYVADSRSITGFTPVKAQTVSAAHLGMVVQAIVQTGKPVIQAPVASIPASHSETMRPTSLTATAAPSTPAAGSRPFFAAAVILAIASLSWVLVRRRA
jgi:hypothetical protein